MPRFEPKDIQKQLDQGVLWPLYWLVGEESLKARELVRRISIAAQVQKGSMEYESLTGHEISGAEVLDRASSLSFGGGVRLIIIQDAEKLKEAELLESILGPSQKLEKLSSVIVAISSSLDLRKKFSKKLIESAAVVSCEAVAENDREAWVKYLAKRRNLTLNEAECAVLRILEPWSLDTVDQELSKVEMAPSADDRLEVLCAGSSSATVDQFMDAFFQKKKPQAMNLAGEFIHSPETALPLLGLISWNARMLLTPSAQPKGGFMQTRFSKWKPYWKISQLKKLQAHLFELDFNLKQTPKPSLGVWNEFILESLASPSALGE